MGERIFMYWTEGNISSHTTMLRMGTSPHFDPFGYPQMSYRADGCAPSAPTDILTGALREIKDHIAGLVEPSVARQHYEAYFDSEGAVDDRTAAQFFSDHYTQKGVMGTVTRSGSKILRYMLITDYGGDCFPL